MKMDQKYLRDHIVSCEYLQIDPSVPHSKEFIISRIRYVISQWDGGEAHTEEIQRTLERYLKAMTAGPHTATPNGARNIFSGTSFRPPTPSEGCAMRCSKLIGEDRLKVLPGTVNETYVKKIPSQENFNYYTSKLPRWQN
ncbi:MAG: hypothetical protein LBE48_04955 [Methanomassiliicoccaceae archaeon]|jgi:hypothetical protein|nr:hypothetical protein [Methanomassiliicoccaceae archaeon]